MNTAIRLKAAKEFILTWMVDEIHQPSDFDTIIGSSGELIEFGAKPTWNKAIFCTALEELVNEKKVTCWKDDKGWHYQASFQENRPFETVVVSVDDDGEVKRITVK